MKTLLSQSLETKTPEQSENEQIQHVIQKNNGIQAKIQVLVPSCHYCHYPEIKLSDTRSTFTMPSGNILSFCNDTEMNNWKEEYSY